MIVCPACRRHHREPTCPYCSAPRPASVFAAGLAALALTGCPGEPPPAPVYGAPPPPVAPVDTAVTPEQTPAPPHGAAPPTTEPRGPSTVQPPGGQ